ncbi:hypothetical protein EDC04DRAFT_2617373 [Pisolithus marmoratus]|nr:hypothetical protein EDC04DRAFT_2617373 [Pisolithus marmoratus]
MSTSNPNHYVLANCALIRVRLKHWVLAIEDVKEVQPSPMGYIVKAVVLLGEGDRAGVLHTFDLAFHDCELHDIRFLLLLKSILVFESGHQEESIMCVEDLATRTDNADKDDTTYLYTQACPSHDADIRVLGAMYTKEGNYGHAIPLIEHAKNLAPKDMQCPSLCMISLIFGWSFSSPDNVAKQHLCEMLYAEGCTAEVVEILLSIIKTSDEIQGSKATADWITVQLACTSQHPWLRHRA